ncbi:G-protein coupled receptor 157 isoform X5 [Mycteria americana]|uniref:G-protein coupled receptor 157 isoform X5 n=1 Tax=Mycteria americana TaxID=33587 RepID=UPI003F58D04C
MCEIRLCVCLLCNASARCLSSLTGWTTLKSSQSKLRCCCWKSLISFGREGGKRSDGSTWGGVGAISRKPELSEFAVSLNSEAGVCTALEPLLGLLAVCQASQQEAGVAWELPWTSGTATSWIISYHRTVRNCWGVPLGITVAAVALKKIGYDASNVSVGWCWVNLDAEDRVLWMLLTGKVWEILAYVTLPVLYILIKKHINRAGIGNTFQGGANCIMFVLCTRVVRTRLFSSICCCRYDELDWPLQRSNSYWEHPEPHKNKDVPGPERTKPLLSST